MNYKSQFAAAMKDPRYKGEMDAVIDAWVDMVEAEAESEGDETAEPKQDARNSDRVAGVAGVA